MMEWFRANRSAGTFLHAWDYQAAAHYSGTPLDHVLVVNQAPIKKELDILLLSNKPYSLNLLCNIIKFVLVAVLL